MSWSGQVKARVKRQIQRQVKRVLLLASLPLALAGCATMETGEPGILIETAARGQPLEGASCVAMIGDMRWDILTPAVIEVGAARETLRIVCNREGFRSSELIFRPAATGVGGLSGGFGVGSYGSGVGLGLNFPLASTTVRYPKRLVIDMNPP